jgi:hypothetical protein
VSDSSAQLRARFPVPADRDLPPGRHLLHRENLMNQILHEPPGSQPGNSEPPRDGRPAPQPLAARRPRARTLLAAAAAAALVAGLSVTAADRLSAHPGAPSGPTAASSAAPAATVTAVLDRIARAAAARPAVPVGPNQYFYVKGKVVGPKPHPTSSLAAAIPTSGPVEGWIAQGQHKESLWVFDGQSTPWKEWLPSVTFGGPLLWTEAATVSSVASKDKLLDPTYAYLQSLPTNPRQLLNLIEQQTSADTAPAGWAFLVIGQLVSTAILPPQTAAALYRAAALIPGVTVVPEATDAVGRHGIGVVLNSGGLREEWIFSKTTYQFIGARTTSADETSVSAVLARGVANSPGGTPTLIK